MIIATVQNVTKTNKKRPDPFCPRIEYYSGCVEEGTKFTSYKLPFTAGRRIGMRELLRIDSYSRAVTKTSVTASGYSTYNYAVKQLVGISFIFKSSRAIDLVVIYSGDDSPQQWEKIIRAADSYAYAEHSEPGTPLKNWPNSKYGFPLGDSPFNNSNTFIRVMAGEIGRRADVVPGFHPGNNSPVPVQDKGPIPIPQPK